MYMNTGYLNHSHMDFKDKSRPLVVGSCGTYRLSSHPKLPTYRPRGRLDYQIIYIYVVFSFGFPQQTLSFTFMFTLLCFAIYISYPNLQNMSMNWIRQNMH